MDIEQLTKELKSANFGTKDRARRILLVDELKDLIKALENQVKASDKTIVYYANKLKKYENPRTTNRPFPTPKM